jgi:hypothetical protein
MGKLGVLYTSEVICSRLKLSEVDYEYKQQVQKRIISPELRITSFPSELS